MFNLKKLLVICFLIAAIPLPSYAGWKLKKPYCKIVGSDKVHSAWKGRKGDKGYWGIKWCRNCSGAWSKTKKLDGAWRVRKEVVEQVWKDDLGCKTNPF